MLTKGDLEYLHKQNFNILCKATKSIFFMFEKRYKEAFERASDERKQKNARVLLSANDISVNLC